LEKEGHKQDVVKVLDIESWRVVGSGRTGHWKVVSGFCDRATSNNRSMVLRGSSMGRRGILRHDDCVGRFFGGQGHQKRILEFCATRHS
jgi:hypothetical protein